MCSLTSLSFLCLKWVDELIIKKLKVGGSGSHGTGSWFSFSLLFLSMIPRFVEALLEFSRR